MIQLRKFQNWFQIILSFSGNPISYLSVWNLYDILLWKNILEKRFYQTIKIEDLEDYMKEMRIVVFDHGHTKAIMP